MAYLSTKDRKAQIIAEYKKAGLVQRRDFTVSADYSQIRVTLCNKAVNLEWAENIARQQESISRCEVSGEILSGGNIYVKIGYSEKVCNELSEGVYGDAIALALEIPEGEQVALPDGFVIFILGDSLYAGYEGHTEHLFYRPCRSSAPRLYSAMCKMLDRICKM